jgi:hypothetical protein
MTRARALAALRVILDQVETEVESYGPQALDDANALLDRLAALASGDGLAWNRAAPDRDARQREKKARDLADAREPARLGGRPFREPEKPFTDAQPPAPADKSKPAPEIPKPPENHFARDLQKLRAKEKAASQ